MKQTEVSRARLNRNDVGRFLFKPKRLDKSTIKEYPIFVMNTVKAYEEVVDFIAARTTPQNVIAFRPSEAAQVRVEDLLSREKDGELSPAEKSELDHYLQIETSIAVIASRCSHQRKTDNDGSRP